MRDDLNRFSGQQAREITEGIKRGDKAYIAQALQLNPSAIRVQTIDLSSLPGGSNPVLVNFPFKSVYAATATDSAANISLKPFSDSENNDYVPLKLKDVLSFDLPASKCYLNWSVQTGKSITLVFFTDATFTSGSFNTSVTSSLDGSSINEFAPVTVSSTAAALVDSSSRNIGTFTNDGPDDGYIGGSGVSAVSGSERGIYLAVGATIVYKNSGSVYFASLGSSVIRFQTES